MRPVITTILSALLLLGCGPRRQNFLMTNYRIGALLTATQGSALVIVKSGVLDRDYHNIIGELTRELDYVELSGNTLKIRYKEQSNYVERPTFVQDLQYNLKSSRVLIFRDIKLEVLDIGDTTLTYKVLDGPSVPPENTNGLEIENPNSPFKDRGTIGITLQGRFIVTVEKDAPAYNAGVSVNDELLEIDGNTTTEITQWNLRLLSNCPSADIPLKLRRNGTTTTVTVHRKVLSTHRD